MHDITPHQPPRPARRSNGAKIAAIVASGVLGVFSLGMFAAGGGLLWADDQKDPQGYLSTDTERFATGTNALTTENLDVDLDGLDALVDDDTYGKVRLQVSSNDGEPVFVGIARTDEVSEYLRGTAHAIVDDVDSSPFRADYRTQDGDRSIDAPAGEGFWDASADGTGTQTLDWDVREGQWSVVVMNADGSSGVDAGVSAGAKLAWLDEAGWILGGGGLLFLGLAGALLYVGVRPARPAPPAAPEAEMVKVTA